MSTVIYNCKRCKVGRRVDYPERIRVFNGHSAARRDESGRTWTPGAFYTFRHGAEFKTDGDPIGLCPSCARPMTFGALQGFMVDSVPCDGRCTGARGHSCECSCGGKNHGRDWAA